MNKLKYDQLGIYENKMKLRYVFNSKNPNHYHVCIVQNFNNMIKKAPKDLQDTCLLDD